MTLIYEWWQWPMLIFASALAIRIAVNINVVDILERRQKNKNLKNQMEMAEECFHIWDVYSNYSKCSICQILISTTALSAHQQICGCNPAIASCDTNRVLNLKGRRAVLTTPHNRRTYKGEDA